MSTIVATTTTVTGSFQLVETPLTASDILSYITNRGQQLNIRNPNISAISSPVLNTVVGSTTGGTLAAATYYYVITALNANGETLRSNEISVVNTGTTSSNIVSWSAAIGATGYRIYRGTTAGGESVYYTVGSVVTYTDTNAASTTGTPTAINTTSGATVTVTIKGTAPVSPVIPGAGQVFNTGSGYQLIVAPQTIQCINLDRISNYVAGTATAVAVTNGLGCFASILQP